VTRIVVKVGGHALESLTVGSRGLVDLAGDLHVLAEQGSSVVVVHGGGPQIADLVDRVGVPSRFVDGLRVTDEATMPLVAMALSLVNVRIVAALNHAGVPAVGLSGADTGLLRAASLGPEWGRVGATPCVRTGLLEGLWSLGFTPVLSPIAVDAEGELLNVNADAVAGAVAGGADADALVLLSDVAQVRADPDDEASSMARLTRAQAESMLDSGQARDGMRPKLRAALEALAGGARQVIVADGTRSHALRDALSGDVPVTRVVA
jgi:acetylglutamate kinase